MGSCYRCIHNPSCKFYAVISLIVLQLTATLFCSNRFSFWVFWPSWVANCYSVWPTLRQLSSAPWVIVLFAHNSCLSHLMPPLLSFLLPLPSSLIAGVNAVIAFSSLGSLLSQGTLFSTPQTTPPFSTGRSFCKQWERSLPPQPAPRGMLTTSNRTTSAPLLLVL